MQNTVVIRLRRLVSHKPSSDMWAIRDATGAQLVNGDHWGDDYLVVTAPGEAEIVKQLLDEAGYPYEIIEQLPHHLRYAIT